MTETAGQPIPGVVVSLVDSSGRATSRTLSDAQGRFTLARTPQAVAFEAVKIGYRPVRRRSLASADSEALRISMERLPAFLSPVRVRADPLCRDSRDRREALALWEQARAALLATVVARDAAAGAMNVVTFTRQLRPESSVVQHLSVRRVTGPSSRPFLAARSAQAFAEGGFMERRGGQEMYFAPDADVLLDPFFAATHCFGVTSDHATRPGLVGLSFEPLQSRRGARVDVRGVLWIDARRQALALLEFRFTGVNEYMERAGAGGELSFETLSNSVAFVSGWTMRFPVLSRGRYTTSRLTVLGVAETGGFVTEARWRDSSVWHGAQPSPRGRVVRAGSGEPVSGALVWIAGAGDTVQSNADGAFELLPLPEGSYAIAASDTTALAFLEPRSTQSAVELRTQQSSEVTLELPSMNAVVASLCEGHRLTGSASTVLGRVPVVGDQARRFTVASEWQSDIRIGGETIVFTDSRQVVHLNDKGSFRVCGATQDRPIRLRLLANGLSVADTMVTPPRGSAIHFVDWAVPTSMLDSISRATKP